MNQIPAGIPRPKFTVISAVYNVSRFLPDFIESVNAQTAIDAAQLEFIMVDDGSTDSSYDDLCRWAEKDSRVTVLTKENGGQATARNLGLTHATGQWVTFLDPDDTVNATYFSSVENYLEKYPETQLIATNMWLWQPNEPEPTDTHPLNFRFLTTRKPRNLLLEPDFFIGSAPAAFFRLDKIRQYSLRFDEQLRPNFEDGKFCIQYLLNSQEPLVGFVKKAQYYYNKRDDGTSTLQRSLADPGRYTVVPKRGYLDMLRAGSEKHGSCPEFIQNHILYELTYYFGAENQISGAPTAAQGPAGDEFRGTLRQIVDFIDPVTIESYRITRVPAAWRDVMLHGLNDQDWHTEYCISTETRVKQRLTRLTLRYTGKPPEIEYFLDGKPVAPEASKVRDLCYFGRALLFERTAWLHVDGTIEVRANGSPLDLRKTWPPANAKRWMPSSLGIGPRPGAGDAATRKEIRRRRVVRILAKTRPVRNRYRDAWLLMDRIHDTGDSGLRLFEYLRESRRDINSWFVLDTSAAEWKSLKRKYRSRLVKAGSLKWLLLSLNSRFRISSHIDNAVYRPPALAPYFKKSWPQYIFLQHGVIKDDLSAWLNPKDIALFVASTPAEHQSIVEDHSRYKFTSVEVKRTGLPRFDRLREIALHTPDEVKDWILVAPTWRNWLTAPPNAMTQRRSVVSDFETSEYFQSWRSYLLNEELRELAITHRARIGFLPHPNFQDSLNAFDLPDWVTPLYYAENDVQELIARSRVVVTDYSSMVFNAAYIDVPVVYYQFDADAFNNGGHTGRSGYFDYGRDGFGPVAFDEGSAVNATRMALVRDEGFELEYGARRMAAFPERDGKCCERLVSELEAM